MSQQHIPTPLAPSTANLVSQLGHDFNNLLGIILGGLSLLQEDLPLESLDPDLRAVIEDMLSATQDASAVIERLTAAAGRQIIEASAVDLNDAITQVANGYRNDLSDGIHLSVQCSSTPSMAWVDPVKLERCLREVVDNALTAVEGHGELLIVCTADPAPRVEVFDNGPGMDADLLKRCAYPYVTTWRQWGHRGLGLSVVQGFLQVSEAQLRIESGLGEGTRVRMEFTPPEGVAALAG